MKINKKIISSVLIGSLALTSFPTNIFANSNQLAIEKKICENIKNKDKELNDFIIFNNDFYYTIFDKNNIKYEDYINLENKDFSESDLYNHDTNIKIEDNIIEVDGEKFTTRILKKENDKEEGISFLKKINNDFYYLILENNNTSFGFSGNYEIYKNNEKISDSFSPSIGSDIIVDDLGNVYYINFENKKELSPQKTEYTGVFYKIDTNLQKEKIREFEGFIYAFDLAGGGEYGSKLKFYRLGNDIYLFYKNYDNFDNFERIYKNGKPLCENLENNNNNNSNNQNTNIPGGSPVDIKDLEVNDNPNVTTQESKKIKKEEEKAKEFFDTLLNEEEAFYVALGYFPRYNSSNYNDVDSLIKDFVTGNIHDIFTKNSYISLKNAYQKISNDKKIQFLASESEFVNYFIEEYKKQFEEMEIYIDSITFTLPKENIIKIKNRVKNFFQKYNTKDILERVYYYLKNDYKLKDKKNTSQDIYYAFYDIGMTLANKISYEDISWKNEIGYDEKFIENMTFEKMEILKEKQKKAFEEYQKNLKK